MRPLYVGQAARGQEKALAYLGDPEGLQRQECAAFLDYLSANGLDALVAGLQALPHNNADYVSQYQQLSVDDREMVGRCARLAAAEIISAEWQSMTPEEQQAHNRWVAQQLAEETQGKPGVSVVCPPETPPHLCAERIHAAVDAAECAGGFSIPLGPVSACVPGWLVWGGAALIIYTIARR